MYLFSNIAISGIYVKFQWGVRCTLHFSSLNCGIPAEVIHLRPQKWQNNTTENLGKQTRMLHTPYWTENARSIKCTNHWQKTSLDKNM